MSEIIVTPPPIVISTSRASFDTIQMRAGGRIDTKVATQVTIKRLEKA